MRKGTTPKLHLLIKTFIDTLKSNLELVNKNEIIVCMLFSNKIGQQYNSRDDENHSAFFINLRTSPGSRFRLYGELYIDLFQTWYR